MKPAKSSSNPSRKPATASLPLDPRLLPLLDLYADPYKPSLEPVLQALTSTISQNLSFHPLPFRLALYARLLRLALLEI